MNIIRLIFIGIVITVITLAMWCCLVLASEDDDREGRG